MPETDRFVNPYAFLPVPKGDPAVIRRPVPGHVLTAGDARARFSGTVCVSWTLATPMLLPLGHAESGVVDADGHVVVPGSSIKGLTRSLHEALFNGCMRIVDLDFVPGYRDAARSDTAKDQAHDTQWTLALVIRSDSAGRPTAVRLCEDEVWIDSGPLLTAYGRKGLPTTGDVIDFDGEPGPPNSLGRVEQGNLSRLEVIRRHDSPEADLESVAGRVFLVTSVGARHDYRKPAAGQPTKKGRCLWASGRLGDEIVDVPERVAQELQTATEGSDDRRRLRQAEDKDGASRWRAERSFEPVEWWLPGGPKGAVARRSKHTGFVWPGEVVWVHLDRHGNVDQVKLSQLCRHPGRVSVGERLDPALHPCDPESPAGVCLTCAIFGAIDADGDRGQGKQSAYAAHVRFGSARSSAPVALRRVLLSPMGTPNPGAGMFYLQNATKLPGNRPLGDRGSDWGSASDMPPRPIAGRKFYWHADPDEQATHWSSEVGRRVPPRYEAVGDQRTGEMARRAELVPAGTVFTARVAFDGIDELSLLTLLWALDPAPLLRLPPSRRDATFAVHLGGGKPLGLGSATVRLGEVQMSSVADRYARQGSPEVTATDHGAPQGHGAALVRRVGSFTKNLDPLARLLDLHGLGPTEHLVAYPPGAPWSGVGTDNFRESYQFFVEVNGEALQGDDKPWLPLPSVTPTGDMNLPIVLKKTRST